MASKNAGKNSKSQVRLRIRRPRKPQIPKSVSDKLLDVMLRVGSSKIPATLVADFLRKFAHRVFYEELRSRARVLLYLRQKGLAEKKR